ncbi:cytidine deaminase [Eubacterium nodatum ATCC 33099]|nr:cytidine deaminase [Eubacterium nodatum ATCC 33099]
MENRELFEVAEQALEKAYAPYSNFKVSAALLTDDRRIFTGVNVENASYGCTICAERTACVKAVSEGAVEFKSIAIVSNKGAVSMCGICRQFLSEFSLELDVITGTDVENLQSVKLRELLPDSFEL